MTDRSDSTYESFMAGVIPLKSKQRVVPKPGNRPPTLGQMSAFTEQDYSTAAKEADANYLADSDAQIEMLLSEDQTYWHELGVQEGVLEKLKTKRYEPESVLDLHEKTVSEARQCIWAFINQCLNLQYRTVRIIHGRGNPASPPSRLKSFVAFWMSQHEDVIAACTPQYGGGTGELMVRLRKQRATKSEARSS